VTQSEPEQQRQRRRATRTEGPASLDTGAEQSAAPASEEQRVAATGTAPAEEPGDSAPPVPGKGRARRRALAAVAATLLVAALVTGVVLLALAKSSANRLDTQREGFLQTARQGVLNLTTIHYATAPADVQHLLDGASGAFAQDFGGKKDSYIQVVQKAQVNSEGKIISSGLARVDGDTGVVLVASTAKVSNSSAPAGEDRSYRLRVTVTDVDGRMTVSNVEFVP
jgi:Mce-associated membrane protein